MTDRDRNARLLVCTEMLRLFSDYLDDTMPVTERLRFEEHLTLCDGCTAFLDNLRDVKDASAGIDDEELTDDVRASFMSSFDLWKRGQTE